MKNIAIVGTLDTEKTDVMYLKEQIEKRGHSTTTVDASADRPKGREGMIEGAKKIIGELHSSGKIDGAISFGGSDGTAIGLDVMKMLPVGMPKIVVTTVRDACFVGTYDITIAPIPEGVPKNREEMEKVLSNAAGAIVGMVEAGKEGPERARPLIAITALGVTTPAIMKMAPLLQERGYEIVTFHARTEMLNRLIKEGKIAGVIDLTPVEVLLPFLYPGTEDYLGGKDRLESAGNKCLPQVICPGGLDMLILSGTMEDVPDEFKDRPLHTHGPETTLIRTTKEEIKMGGKKLVERANIANGPVSIMIPLRGFSAVDKDGQHFYNPEADQGFVEAVKENAQEKVKVLEIDAHINSDEFAKKVVEVFDKMCPS